MSEPSVGVYVHVPFCERVCPYCDFAVVAGRPGPDEERRYVEALIAELAARAEAFAGRRLASLYLGGGTPSLLRPESVARLVESVRERFPEVLSGPVEVTLEVNPSTLERQRLGAFREAGVGRLSIGVQSFDDGVLKRLGRAHAGEESRRTLAAAREAGFDSLSLDLIFAAPGQTLGQLRADLSEVVAFGPEHVSCYELVVEPGTPFALADRRGQLPRADSDAAADMLEAIEEELGGAGLSGYELTNYARPGFESRHNQRYWRREPVLGLGLGAWSTDPPGAEAPFGTRRQNTRALGDYLSGIGGCGSAEVESETLDVATARAEAMFLALRTREGLAAGDFRAEFGASPRDVYGDEIVRLVDEGLLLESGAGDLKLSPRGRMLSDAVCACFVEAGDGSGIR